MKKLLLIALLAFLIFPINSLAHCDLACELQTDEARFEQMLEHIKKIEESMNEINNLEGESKIDYDAVAKWRIIKDENANKIQEIASEYFLTQRVEIPLLGVSHEETKIYEKHTTLLHHILVKAMRIKLTTDTSVVEDLRKSISDYKIHYFKYKKQEEESGSDHDNDSHSGHDH